MIEATVFVNKKNKIVGLSAQGHAGSGPYGHDLVCAGVSSVITGGFNAIEDKQEFDMTLFEGYAKVKPWFNNARISKHDLIVLDTIVTQLMTIQEAHPKSIAISKTCLD